MNNVTWIEIVEGKKVVKRCKLVEFVKKHLCVVDSYGYRCFDEWEPKRVLKVWNETETKPIETNIYVRINVTIYREIWLKENPGMCLYGEYTPGEGYVCHRWLSTNSSMVRDRTIFVKRIICGEEVFFEIPIVTLPDRRLEKTPTYLVHVVAPAIKNLVYVVKICGEPSLRALAKAIKDFVVSGGYCHPSKFSSLEEMLMYCSGDCDVWAGIGSLILDITTNNSVKHLYVLAGMHASEFICEPWWNTPYKVVVKIPELNRTLICSLWIDTGYLIEHWHEYLSLGPAVLTYKGKTIEIRSVKPMNK